MRCSQRFNSMICPVSISTPKRLSSAPETIVIGFRWRRNHASVPYSLSMPMANKTKGIPRPNP